MERSIEDIYNEMVFRKQSFSNLANYTPLFTNSQNPYQEMLTSLNNLSKVSIWQIWFWLIATAHYTIEVLFGELKTECEAIAIKNTFGSLPWYRDKLFAFQYNFLLIFNSSDYTYAYSDTTSQLAIDAWLIKRASVTEVKTLSYNAVLMKLAKADTTGNLLPLSAAEQIAVDSYIDRIKPPGIKTQIISLPADLWRGDLVISYDGTLDLNEFSTTVETAIKLYLKNIPFDGIFYEDDFVAFMKSTVSGLIHIAINSIFAKSFTGSFQPVINSYNPVAGYFEFVPISNSGSSIQYIAV